MTRKSNRSSGVQRADGWCEFGTSASGEWSCELCPKSYLWQVGDNGDSTVIWELDIQA